MTGVRSTAVAHERGAALLLALLTLSLLSAIAVVLLLSASSEVLIAGAFRDQRAGVYAADARKLSVRAAFPTLWEMEERGRGSVVRGSFSRPKQIEEEINDRSGRALLPLFVGVWKRGIPSPSKATISPSRIVERSFN